jgi:hypothetical protein
MHSIHVSGKPERRPELLNDEDCSIISRDGAEYRGIVQYYLLAGDVYRLDRLHWVMVTSLLKTLAGKYDSSVSKMARTYGAAIATPHGPRRCLQVSVDRGEGRKPPGRDVRWYPAEAAEERGPAGPRTSPSPRQGGRQSRPQGDGAQATGTFEGREVCVMQIAEPASDVHP